MRNLGFIISVVGFLAFALAAPPVQWSSAAAASATESATLAARPVPSPAIGGRPALPAPPAPVPIQPGPPHVIVPQGAVPIVGFRHAISIAQTDQGGNSAPGPASAAVFGSARIPAGIAVTNRPSGGVTLVGPGDQYIRFEYTVQIQVPPAAPQSDGGIYDVVLVKDPTSGNYCWVMDESRFAFKPIGDTMSGSPGTITQRDGGSDLFVVTGYPVNSGYCRR
jgi:hypothetical protein